MVVIAAPVPVHVDVNVDIPVPIYVDVAVPAPIDVDIGVAVDVDVACSDSRRCGHRRENAPAFGLDVRRSGDRQGERDHDSDEDDSLRMDRSRRSQGGRGPCASIRGMTDVLDLKTRIKKTIVERLKLDVEPSQIGDTTPLFGEGLGLDSIDALELVLGIEQEFGVKVEDEEVGARALASVDALADFVLSKQQVAAS